MIGYLCSAVAGKGLKPTPLKNISMVQYSFDQLMMVLNNSIQLEHEIAKASTSSKTSNGRFNTHPSDVRNYDFSHTRDSRDCEDYRSQRHDDPKDII